MYIIANSSKRVIFSWNQINGDPIIFDHCGKHIYVAADLSDSCRCTRYLVVALLALDVLMDYHCSKWHLLLTVNFECERSLDDIAEVVGSNPTRSGSINVGNYGIELRSFLVNVGQNLSQYQ